MKRFFLVFSISILAVAAKAQTSSTAGAWTTGSNWSTGTAPSTGSLSTNVVINKAMTFNSGSLTGWGSTTITITTGGSLTVTGNFSLTGSGVNITVQSGGSLSVSGTTTVTNGARLTIAGGATPGSASFATLAVTANGQFTVNSGASATATSLTTSNNIDAIVTNAGTLTVNGNVTSTGYVINSGTLQVNGNYTQNDAGYSTTNSGRLNVTGNAFANGLIQLTPGTSANSDMIVNGSLTVDANPWVIVGTTVSATCNVTVTYYADLVVKTNLTLSGSGDVTVRQNGRMAVFGNIDKTGGGGGNLITINCGGQAYVHGNINIGTGGGNTVTNSNTSGSPQTGTNGSPIIGLYVNGTTTAQVVAGTVGTKSDLQANDLPFFTWIGTLPASPLPIKLLFFKVEEVTSRGVSLQWATSMEKNFDYFQLERASSSLSFEPIINWIDAMGDLDVVTRYGAEDYTPLSGKNYYRLKSIDLDGTFEYSNVIAAEWAGKSAGINLYPNPITNHSFTIELNDIVSTPSSLSLCDVRGHVVFETSIDSSTSTITIPESIGAGLYLAKVGVQTVRVVVK